MFILIVLGEGEEARREKRGKSGGKMAVPTRRDVKWPSNPLVSLLMGMAASRKHLCAGGMQGTRWPGSWKV